MGHVRKTTPLLGVICLVGLLTLARQLVGLVGPVGPSPTRPTRLTKRRLLANPSHRHKRLLIYCRCHYFLIFPLLTYCCPRYIFFVQDDHQKGGVSEAKVIQNRPFIRVGRYGHFRTEWTSQEDIIYPVSQTARSFNNLRKIMEKSGFLHENAQYWFDIDLARVSTGSSKEGLGSSMLTLRKNVNQKCSKSCRLYVTLEPFIYPDSETARFLIICEKKSRKINCPA